MADKEYIGLARITQVFTLLKNKLLTIKNPSNTAMTKRYILQFKDAKITDDSVGGATKVEVVSELNSESDFDNLATDGTADGIYSFPNSGEKYLTADNVGYGNGTVNDALDNLTATTLTIGDSTSLSDGAAVTFTSQSDGYLIAYTTNSDTFIQISPVSDFSVSFTIVKNASSSIWSFDHIYLRKGMTVYVKATGGTHGYYRFCSIS